MASLIVGGVTIPVAPGGISRDRLDLVDRARAFDGTYRASATGNPKKEYAFSTPPVTRAWADFYELVLSKVTALVCSGDIIGGGSNLLPYSEDFSTWTDVGGVTVTGGQPDPTGGTSGTQLSDPVAGGSNARRSDVTFTGNGTKAVSVYGKYINAADSRISVFDITAGTHRRRINIAWNAGAVPTVTGTEGAGTIHPVVALGEGWYRIEFGADSIVAANTNKVYLYPSFGATGSTYFFGVQAENAAVPTSYTRTAGAAVSTLTASCCPELTGWSPVRVGSGHYVVLDFVLKEA